VSVNALKSNPIAAWVAQARQPAIVVATCLLLAFGFLGLRGIWDPDEGRYTNVALTMLETGDWLNPRRSEDTEHWTKPPMAYWLIAGSVATFGRNPWAARLPIALSYLACVLLAGLCARRLAPGSGGVAALAYATMLLPHAAGQLVTTDFPLAAFQALAMYAFLEYRFGPTRRPWLLPCMWVALAAAFMTKGPPALLPLAVIGAMGWLAPGRPTRVAWHLLGVALFLLLALPWFAIVSARHPGLLQYFLGAELVDRVASDRFGRNGQWYGWIAVYLPTLVLGTLPWTGDLWRWLRELPARMDTWRDREGRTAQAGALLVVLWIAIPLLVFCFARSRLPLYLLPIFVPLAVLVAQQRGAQRLGMPAWLVGWIVVLLLARVAVAQLPTHKDASRWAQAIQSRMDVPVREVVFVEDMARYGLHLHLDAEIEKLSRVPLPQPRFEPEYDEPLMREVAEVGREPGLVFVAKSGRYPEIAGFLHARGYTTRPLGGPCYGRVIFEVIAPPRARPTPLDGD